MVQAKPPGAVSTGGNEVVVAIIIPQEEESLGKAPRVSQGRLKGTTPQDLLGLWLWHSGEALALKLMLSYSFMIFFSQRS